MNISGINPNIPSIGGTELRQKVQAPAGGAEQVEKTFGQLLENLSETQQNSDNLVQRMAAGEDVDIHDVMIASEETEINFRIALGIRDRLVEAYREVMRMGV